MQLPYNDIQEKLYQDGLKKIKELTHSSKADLHIHSNYSDGRPSIEEILEYTQHKTDLELIAITDHDTIEGALKAQKIVQSGHYRFSVIIGEEVSTKAGHIIGLFLTEPVPPHLSVHETIERIHAQGGIAVAAHPFFHTRMNGGKMVLMDGIGVMALMKEKDGLDGIEVVNATPTLRDENLSARFLNSTLLFRAEIGGSDAHILEAIGHGFTLFEGKYPHDLKEAIQHTQTRASSKRWRFMTLVRYGYFFLPKGFRLLFYTMLHGRKAKRPRLVNIFGDRLFHRE